MLIGLHMIILILKYYCLNICILNSSSKIHDNMINGIVRSPASFFDSTPSGLLVNKFSNDLGVIDNCLVVFFIDSMEGSAAIISALINACQISVFFIGPAVVIVIISLLFFRYARPVIISTKQLDLQNKNPIFHCFSETINGLTQIRVYNKRKIKIQ